jgi:hypothetical protein
VTQARVEKASRVPAGTVYFVPASPTSSDFYSSNTAHSQFASKSIVSVSIEIVAVNMSLGKKVALNTGALIP